MQDKGFEVDYDSLTEANWFSSLHPAFDIMSPKNRYEIIKRRGSNPQIIEDITAYDKPDIILLQDGKPLLVIEITSEVPTGHNVGQRFARLVRAIELGIPTIYFFPFDAKKHGEYAGMCNMNARLLLAAKNIYTIHKTPLMCVDWITDSDGEIITDGSEDAHIKSMLASYVSSGFSKQCKGFVDQLTDMDAEYARRVATRPSYKEMPNSVSKMPTSAFIRAYRIDTSKVDDDFINRPFTYIYTMDMTPANCKRQDPYTGMTFIYDYVLCRNGADVSEKSNNLVLRFPSLTKRIWHANNPNDPNTKSCNWYLTANMLLYLDDFDFLR